MMASLARMLLAASLFALAVTSPAEASSERCGTKMLYGKTLTLHTMGEGVSCGDVERITRGACTIPETARWGCFSFRARSPVLVWFRTAEMFDESWSGWIEARRPACSKSSVSARRWRRAGKARGHAFPTELQVLSDDLVRCRQLRGKRFARVVDLLGKPDEVDRRRVGRTAYWEVGPERDSFFQVDSESLTVRFGAKGRVRSAGFSQG